MKCTIKKNRTTTDQHGNLKFIMKFYDDSDVFLHSVTWQKEINGEDNSLDESEWNDWRDDMLKQLGDMYSVTWTDITVTEDA